MSSAQQCMWELPFYSFLEQEWDGSQLFFHLERSTSRITSKTSASANHRQRA